MDFAFKSNLAKQNFPLVKICHSKIPQFSFGLAADSSAQQLTVLQSDGFWKFLKDMRGRLVMQTAFIISQKNLLMTAVFHFEDCCRGHVALIKIN